MGFDSAKEQNSELNGARRMPSHLPAVALQTKSVKMEQALNTLLPVVMVAVLISLGVGLYTLVRGGDVARSRSNKLMRLRVILQAVAIAILLAAFWFKSRGG